MTDHGGHELVVDGFVVSERGAHVRMHFRGMCECGREAGTSMLILTADDANVLAMHLRSALHAVARKPERTT